jgi:hypothetical protein
MSTISKHSSWKGLLATLAVLATAGVYCELESSPAGVAGEANAPKPVSVASGPSLRDPKPERADVGVSARSPATSPRLADLEPSREPAPARASSPRGRREEPQTEAADEPREDPVAQATKAFAGRLEAEPFDAKWAPVAEGLIAEHFPAGDGRTLKEARCRSSVCRIELAFESEAARDDEIGSLTLPWDSVGVFQLDDQDSLTLVIYATREPEDMLPRG